jgi:glucokinase
MEAIQKMVQRALRRGEQTSLVRRLYDREHFSQQLLAEEALRGDTVALQVYGEVGKWLGAATAKYITIYEPNILILGGGMLCANELLIAHVRSALMAQSSSKVYEMLEVVPSRLGADAALIGAVSPYF